jgi:hypothetical protein
VSLYRALILADAPAAKPNLVEAYMRMAHGTLDGLTRGEFLREARRAARRVIDDGPELAEQVADSYGLSTAQLEAYEKFRSKRRQARGLTPGYVQRGSGDRGHVKAVNGDHVPVHGCAPGPNDPSCCATCGVGMVRDRSL